MRFDIIVRGGTVVNADGQRRVDVGIRGQRIVAVAKGLAGGAGPRTTVIDARGKYVIPGAIDAHVHMELERSTMPTSDNWDTGPRAAARGGVTTVIDFATPERGESLREALARFRDRSRGRPCIDYACHIAVTDFKRHAAEMPQMVRQGCPTFKAYMTYGSRGLMSDDRAIFGELESCRRLGAMLLVHAESDGVLEELIERHHTRTMMRKFGARLHAMTRPNFIEAEAIARAITWAEATGGRLYIVHTSTGEGADLVRAAQARGAKVFAETCPHYLVLDDSVFSRPDGHRYICSPQVKKREDSRRLWKGLQHGELSVVATDHCVFNRKQKDSWAGDWTRTPSGLPGTETMVPLLFTHGVLKRRITMKRLVALCCFNPAKLMGLYPAKGVVALGSDADVAVIDPHHRVKVVPDRMETNTDWSPYENWTLGGFPEWTLCRGRPIVRQYEVQDAAGWGRWIRRRKPAGDLIDR
jgi:dihydropyrimidinase